MAESTSSSQVSLIPLEEPNFTWKKTETTKDEKPPNNGFILPGNGSHVETAPITSKRSWHKIRRKRKVGSKGGEFMTEHVKTSTNVQPLEKPHKNKEYAKNDSHTTVVPAENVEESAKKKNSFFLWLKSIFSRDSHSHIDLNNSNKRKLMYFGFIIPALAFSPSILNLCNTPIYGDDFRLKLAAAHIDDALNGRGRFGSARAAKKSKTVQRCFKVISSRYWEYLMYFFIALHCLMIIWEQSEPVSIGSLWANGWSMNIAILIIDALCITVYAVDIVLSTVFLSCHHFWMAKENFWLRVECVFTIFFLVDYIILILEKTLGRRLLPPFRCFRAAMLLCKSKNVGHIFKVLMSIMSKLGKVYSIIGIFIFTFASIGLHIYMENYHYIPEVCRNATTSWNCSSVYSGAFDHVAIASLHMFVLMSTENYPDVIIPAFDVNQANFFYFMLYLYVGVFFLMAILLAIIVESYWEYSKKHVKMERLRQREELVKAWNLLDLNGTGYLSVDDPKMLKLFEILRPKNSEEENLELISYISDYNDEYIIDSYDWTTRLLETFNIEFEPEEPIEGDENSEAKRKTKPSSVRRASRKVIHAHGIGVFILVLILLHSILFGLMWNGITDITQLCLQALRTFIMFVFFVEVIVRVFADGTKLLNILDILDIIMVVVAITGNIIWYVLWFQYNRAEVTIYLGACIVASSLAVLARLLFNSEQARTAVQVLRNIYPVMFDLILLVITIIFFYAVIGLESFQDATLAKSTASGFEGSYVQYGCGVGFESFGCALLIVFQIVTTNDWHQIMLGAMIDSGWASAIYFLSCYLIVDMIVMNLFVAISIEAYKKLARDKRGMADQLGPVSTPDVLDGDQAEQQEEEEGRERGSTTHHKLKNEQSIRKAAKTALSGLFASTRTSKSPHASNNNTITSANGVPFLGRRGTRGSISTVSLPRTPVLDRDSSDEDQTIVSRGSLPGTPLRRGRSVHGTSEVIPRKRMSLVNAPDTGMLRRKNNSVKEPSGRVTPTRVRGDRRQGAMKARSDQRRRERREKKMKEATPSDMETEDNNNLKVPEPKLSISDIVRLKKSVKVLLSYRAKTGDEMTVHEGQVLPVTEDNGHMYRGPAGWFPKSHTMDMGASARHSISPLPEDASFSQSDSPATKRKSVNFRVENEQIPNDKFPSASKAVTGLLPAVTHPSLQHRHSQARMKRRTDGSDWRRDILGDITVMNKDEMQELNKQLRGGLFEKRHNRNSRPALYRPQQNRQIRMVEEEIIEERDELPEVPEVTVSEAPHSSPFNTDESSPEGTVTKSTNTLTLTVPGSTPKKQRRHGMTMANPKKNGEMPEWMKNFVAEKGIEVEENQNFDDGRLPSAGSSDEEDRLSRLSGILVHQSDTSTNSSQENLQDMSVDRKASENSALDHDSDDVTGATGENEPRNVIKLDSSAPKTTENDVPLTTSDTGKHQPTNLKK